MAPFTFTPRPLVIAVAAASSLLTANAALAAAPCTAGTTYTVTTEAGDNSAGSLRAAIEAANTSTAGCDQVEFAAGVANIVLQDSVVITDHVNIVGPGADQLSVRFPGGTAFSSSTTDGIQLYLSGLTIENSDIGISQTTSLYTTLTVLDSVIRNNSSNAIVTDHVQNVELNNVTISGHKKGPAVILDSSATATNTTLTVIGSTFLNNTNSMSTSGGALYMATGPFADNSISGSLFSGNGSGSTVRGGAVAINFVGYGSTTSYFRLENNTFADNRAGDGGAVAIYTDSDTDTLNVVMRQNTLAGNSASGKGGAVWIEDTGVGSEQHIVAIESSSLVSNAASQGGGGVYVGAGSDTELRNTLVAKNSSGNGDLKNISGTLSAMNYSWIGDNGILSYGISSGAGTGNVTRGDETTLVIGSLNDNGGDLPTIAVGAASPLVDAGDPAATVGSGAGQILATDQRGGTRVVNTVLDIGAFEYDSATDVDVPAVTSVGRKSDSGSGSFGSVLLIVLGVLGLRRRR